MDAVKTKLRLTAARNQEDLQAEAPRGPLQGGAGLGHHPSERIAQEGGRIACGRLSEFDL